MTRRSALLFSLAALLALGLSAACSAGNPTSACQVGSDCTSGVCERTGFCGPPVTTGGSTTTGSHATTTSTGGHPASGTGGAVGTTAGTGGAAGSGGSSGTGQGGSAGSGFCMPNGSVVITSALVPLAAGLHANFLDAESVTVDTAGTTLANGSRAWDLTGMLSGDHAELVQTLPLAGLWFAADFPKATYASKLSGTSDLLGVFEVTSTGLLLLGVASPTAGASQTEVTYVDPTNVTVPMPVSVLSFPMLFGSSWTTPNVLVKGTASGLPVAYFESYVSTVDAHGTLKTPYATFPVLRVRTDLTRTVGGLPTTTRTYGFVTDCFGTVATIVSQSNEAQVEFTSAAEVNRLTP